MYYVYILELNNGQHYTGYTADLKRRVLEHKYGKCKFTSTRQPVTLIYYEAYLDKADAEARENYLKHSDGKKDIQRQLQHYLKSR